MTPITVTTDNRIPHAIRHLNGAWQGAVAMDLTGINGRHHTAGITGTH
ncbi:hypothetical protein [Streptomyces sp. NPDC096339]